MPVIQYQQQNLEHCGQMGREGPEDTYNRFMLQRKGSSGDIHGCYLEQVPKMNRYNLFDTKVTSRNKGHL